MNHLFDSFNSVFVIKGFHCQVYQYFLQLFSLALFPEKITYDGRVSWPSSVYYRRSADTEEEGVFSSKFVQELSNT